MKKILTLMIAAAMMIGFTACEKDNEKEKPNTFQIGDRTYEIGASCCYWATYDEFDIYDLWFANKQLWTDNGNWPDEIDNANGFEVNVYSLLAIGAAPGKIASGTYTYSPNLPNGEGNFVHDGCSDYYEENGNFSDYIEFGQDTVADSKLVIKVKHINDNIYEIEFTGGIDERGNPVSGYYKGAIDMFED